MIFGKTKEQRKLDRLRREHWHWHFAWLPVQLDTGRIAWMQRVRRKGKWCCGKAGIYYEYEYKVGD